MRRWIVTVALGAAVLVAAGCGGDDGESATTQWAGGVCEAMATWKEAVTDIGGTLASGGLSADGLREAAGDVQAATETLVDDLKGLGRPDTDAGQQAEEVVTGLADELSSQAETIEKTVEGASGVSGTLQAVSTVTAALGTMGTEIGTAVTELSQLDGAQELEDAFKDADACQELTSN